MSKGAKKAVIIVVVIAAVVLMLVQCGAGTYNKMVAMDEDVTSQWAEVQNQYQRRYDLIPNLVQTVKGYAKHESDVYTQVAEARSKAGGGVKIDDKILTDPQAFERYQQAQDQLGSTLQRLLMVTENYPELKADQNFLALQDQLEGTENRITVARNRFNDSAKTYNSFIRKFPNNFIANMSNFEKKQYFSAATEAQSAPKVQF